MAAPGTVSVATNVEWNGERLGRAVTAGAKRGVTKGAEFLKSLSVPKAPIDTAALRGSATVLAATDAASVGGTLIEAVLLFDEPYAAVQHERLDYHHDDGQAKYVEEPMIQQQRQIQGIIAAEVRESISHA